MQDLVKFVQEEFVAKKELPDFSAGDTITVYYEIKEGEKSRTQFFRGVVIQRRGSSSSETFTIRKMSGTVGVERIFPVNLPAIQKIEVNKSNLYHLLAKTGCQQVELTNLSSTLGSACHNAVAVKLLNGKPTLPNGIENWSALNIYLTQLPPIINDTNIAKLF